MRTYRKTKPEHGKLHWGSKVRIMPPVEHDGLATFWYQVPFTGTPSKALIQKALNKLKPESYFGRTFRAVVTKVEKVDSVAIVKITHSI